MADENISASESLRPVGKRQMSGDATVSASSARTQGPEVSEGKGNIFSRFVEFIKSVVSELRKVIWPTWRQMGTYTSVVLLFLIILTALVAGVDFLSGKGVEWALVRNV